MNPDLQNQIAIWRRKAADGSLTEDEMRQAVIALRAGRVGAATAAARSKAKAKAAIPTAESLLKELGL